MQSFTKTLALCSLATLAAFASMTASAQSDGADYRPHQTAITAPIPEVNAGAMAAARPTDTEAIGQSTAAPTGTSQLTREEVYKGAVEATHPMSTESIGQSTGMAGIPAGTPH